MDYLRRGDRQKANIYLTKAEKLGPSTPNDYYQLGWIYDSLYQFIQAKKMYLKAYNIQKSSIYAEMFIIDSLVLGTPNVAALCDSILSGQGEQDESTGRIKELRKLYNSVNELNSREVNTLKFLVKYSYYPHALQFGNNVSETMKLTRNNFEFFRILASIELDQGNIENAQGIYNSMLNAGDIQVDNYLGLAECYLKLSQYIKAFNMVEESFKKEKTSRGYTVLGMIYNAQNNPLNAKMAIDLAIKIDPNNAKAYFEMGKIFEKSDIHKATEFYKKSLNIGNLEIKDILYATEKSVVRGE